MLLILFLFLFLPVFAQPVNCVLKIKRLHTSLSLWQKYKIMQLQKSNITAWDDQVANW